MQAGNLGLATRRVAAGGNLLATEWQWGGCGWKRVESAWQLNGNAVECGGMRWNAVERGGERGGTGGNFLTRGVAMVWQLSMVAMG